PAAIKAVVAVVADRLERLREVRLLEDRSRHWRRAVWEEDVRGLRGLREAVLVIRDRLRKGLRHDEAVAGEADRGIDERLPRQVAGPAVRERQAGDRARDSGGQGTLGRGRDFSIGPGLDEEVLPRRPRRDLAEVHGEHLALRVPGDPEAASADVA